MEKLVFVTGNINKGYEIEEKFNREGIPVEVVKMDFVEPEVNDIEEVSRSKALQAYEALGRPCFVIDSGFNIFNYPGNPGYPGAFVRRSGISSDIDGLLDVMKDVSDRECQFMDCLTFCDGDNLQVFYGMDKGELALEKRGVPNRAMRSDLWYVFIPTGSSKTLGEMSDFERLARRDGHVSAKEQFISWYREHYLDAKKFIKK